MTKRHQDKSAAWVSSQCIDLETPSPNRKNPKKKRRRTPNSNSTSTSSSTPRRNGVQCPRPPRRRRIYLAQITSSRSKDHHGHHSQLVPLPLPMDAYAPVLCKEIDRVTCCSCITHKTTSTHGSSSSSSSSSSGMGWNHLAVGDIVLVRIDAASSSSSEGGGDGGRRSITTPPKKFRMDKHRPWYPFECPHAPCQILAIYETNGDDDDDNDDEKDEKEQQEDEDDKDMKKRKRGEDDTVVKGSSLRMVVRWFFRKSEVRGATWVGQDKKGLGWKEIISQNCLEEIVEADEHAIQDGISPEMLLARVSLVDHIIKDDDDKEQEESGCLTWKGDKLGVSVGKDGVPIVKYICKSFLSQDKKISNISRETGQCHFEQQEGIQDGSSEMDRKEMNELVESWIRRGKDVFSTRRFGRGLQCLNVNPEQRMQFLEAWCQRDSSKETNHVLDDNGGDDENRLNSNHGGMETNASTVGQKDNMEGQDNDNNASDHESVTSLSGASVSMWSSQPPFHVDVSAQRAFYMSMTVVPPSHVYAVESNIDIEKDEWTVKMGDVVAIQIDECDMNRHRGKNISKEMVNHPYKVPWWCAEVVAIYRDLDSMEEAMELRKESSRGDEQMGVGESSSILSDYESHGQFHLELRWFYRLEDIPGFKNTKGRKKKGLTNNDYHTLEELFETDDVDVFSADTLLGPISLHTDPNAKNPTITYQNGMPVVHFVCFRFWTIFRKTLMPAGSSDTRLQRSMMYSKFLGKGSATRASYEEANGTKKPSISNSVSIRGDIDWMAEFTNTISKLNLAESSSRNYGGDVIGRETQQSQIKKFLYSSLTTARDQESCDASLSNSFSLFIAGPPGTGKTASVNSIIHQMYHEQAEGLIPEFTFVSINGMEMRHPFDVYVRLWEAVSPSKEVLDRPKSLAKLQLYFSESSLKKTDHEDKNRRNNRRAVVLLVDEIDYLVTEKQTILYNLFDWPLAGYENKSDAQLIVIGISNTLNLPERLHPRLVSRIGKQRCIYQSYTWSESLTIIEGKLGQSVSSGESIFHPDAMKFASKKVASESGDIRKMFQLCKSAAENVFIEIKSGKRKLDSNAVSGKGMIGITDIQNAAKQMFHTVLYLAVTHATAYQALLFVALASLQRSTGRRSGGFTLEEVIIKMESMANAFGNSRYLPCPQYHMVMSMLSPLAEAGILKLSTCNGTQAPLGTNGFNRLISLKIEANEVLSSLKDTVHFELAQKYLDQISEVYNK